MSKLLTTINDMPKKLSSIHPGEILHEEFLEPLGLTQYRLAHDISVPPRRINEIVKGLRSITADTALRLARYFGNSAQFWLNLQTHYDINKEAEKLSKRLSRDVKIFSRSSVRVLDNERAVA